MLLAALIVGFVTAWSFGPRVGLFAAVATLSLFILALLFPVLSLYVYAVVGVGVAGVSFVAARRPRHPLTSRVVSLGRLALDRLRRGRAQ